MLKEAMVDLLDMIAAILFWSLVARVCAVIVRQCRPTVLRSHQYIHLLNHELNPIVIHAVSPSFYRIKHLIETDLTIKMNP